MSAARCERRLARRVARARTHLVDGDDGEVGQADEAPGRLVKATRLLDAQRAELRREPRLLLRLRELRIRGGVDRAVQRRDGELRALLERGRLQVEAHGLGVRVEGRVHAKRHAIVLGRHVGRTLVDRIRFDARVRAQA